MHLVVKINLSLNAFTTQLIFKDLSQEKRTLIDNSSIEILVQWKYTKGTAFLFQKNIKLKVCLNTPLVILLLPKSLKTW